MNHFPRHDAFDLPYVLRKLSQGGKSTSVVALHRKISNRVVSKYPPENGCAKDRSTFSSTTIDNISIEVSGWRTPPGLGYGCKRVANPTRVGLWIGGAKRG